MKLEKLYSVPKLLTVEFLTFTGLFYLPLNAKTIFQPILELLTLICK